MKVPGLLRKQNYGKRFDCLMDRATGIFNELLSRASKTPHNYIIDQTNVYQSARIRKLKAFVKYRKVGKKADRKILALHVFFIKLILWAFMLIYVYTDPFFNADSSSYIPRTQ